MQKGLIILCKVYGNSATIKLKLCDFESDIFMKLKMTENLFVSFVNAKRNYLDINPC